MQFQEDYQIIYDALLLCRQKIETIKTIELDSLKFRVLNQIGRELNFVSHQLNKPFSSSIPEIKSQPLTKMFGKELVVNPPEPKKLFFTPKEAKEAIREEKETNIDKSVTAAEKDLKTRVMELYPEICKISSDRVLDLYDEMTIRGVGKVAGLPVTETLPKVVNSVFVDQIKEAIKIKNEGNN